MWVDALPPCVSVSYLPARLEKANRSPETGVTDSCEPACRCWKLNSSSPEKQPVPLTTALSFAAQKVFLHSPEMVPSIMGWAFPCQSPIKTTSYRLGWSQASLMEAIL